jgi:hypothetical protein
VISNPEVKRTLATLRKEEFGFLGVIVEKLTDKSPLLPLYRTVHEIFTSYGSSFNSFEVVGSIRMAQSYVWTPIGVEKLRTVQGCICLDVMATRSDVLQSSKDSSLPSQTWVGKTNAPVRTTGQHHLDAEILDKDIACIQSATIRTLG